MIYFVIIMTLVVGAGLYWINQTKGKIPAPENSDQHTLQEAIPPLTGINRKYHTNYYSLKDSHRRESPRFKTQRKEEIGEYKIEVQLDQLPSEFKRISNLLLKTAEGIEQIDHLVISPYGFFLLEVKSLAGLIVGEEEDPNWYQSINWRVKAFPNPLSVNLAHIETLQALIEVDETFPFFSFVTFNRRCDLKVISGSVFFDTDILAALLRKAQQEVLSQTEVNMFYDKISQANILDQSIRNEYAARLHKQKITSRPKYGDIRCTICQKPLTERAARYCLAHPNKFNWQIYCAKHQKEINRVNNIFSENSF